MDYPRYSLVARLLIALQIAILLGYTIFSFLHFREYFALTLVGCLGIGLLSRVYGLFAAPVYQTQGTGSTRPGLNFVDGQ